MRSRLSATAAAVVAAGVVFGGGVASAEPRPAVPTFSHGLAQAVFSTNPADWHSGEAWVQAPFDSDGDHKQDRIHVDFTAPGEVVSDGLKVPVIFEDSPYYAGTADEYSNWGVDHELGFPPAFRPLAPFWTRVQHEPDDQHPLRESVGVARVRSRARRVARHGPLRRVPDLRRPQRDARGRGRDRLAERPRAGLLGPHGRHSRRRDVVDGSRRHDGHVLQRDDPDSGCHHGGRGPRGHRPDLGHLRLVRLLPRQRHGAGAALVVQPVRQQQRVPGRGSRRARRRRLLAHRRDGGAHDLPARDRLPADAPRPRHRQPQRRVAGAQLHEGASRTSTRPRSSRTATTTST